MNTNVVVLNAICHKKTPPYLTLPCSIKVSNLSSPTLLKGAASPPELHLFIIRYN